MMAPSEKTVVLQDQVTVMSVGDTTRRLTASEFQILGAVPAAAEWFANLHSAGTRRVYQTALREFMNFLGIDNADEFTSVTRAHVIAWRKDLEQRELAPATLRGKLAAIASLFDYLCEKNAVLHNPVKGVKRPPIESIEGKTPALGDHQARALLHAPDPTTRRGKRDRAILAVLLFQALRREELCKLRVGDVHERRGVKHFLVRGKGGKQRYIAISAITLEALQIYLNEAPHGLDPDAALFIRSRTRDARSEPKALTPDAVYKLVRGYVVKVGLLDQARLGPHAMRATAATNALEHGADLKHVQAWLGHSNIQTTRIYDHRDSRAQDSPSFKVDY